MYWKVLFLSTVLFSTIFVRDSTQTRRLAIENGVFGELPHGKHINPFSCATCHCTPKPVCKLPVLSPEVSLHSCLTISPYMKVSAAYSLETLVNYHANLIPELMNPLYAIESFSNVIVVMGLLGFATMVIILGVWCLCTSVTTYVCIQYPVGRCHKSQSIPTATNIG